MNEFKFVFKTKMNIKFWNSLIEYIIIIRKSELLNCCIYVIDQLY